MQMPDISRRRALAYVAAVLALLVVGSRFVSAGTGRPVPDAAPRVVVPKARAAPPRLLVVDVVGAVRRPGLYRLKEGSRIDDALRAAGGATAKAVLAAVNLASPIADGEQIAVPSAGGGAATAAGTGGSGALGGSGLPGAPIEKVHLNSATVEQLDSLPGVGPVTAQKILAYRRQHGAFHSVEELDAVPGIGPARLQDLKPLVDL
ncbi:MAG: ComEA family DNA-binding protein [Actinobacteria bacterium]|nr:MAG: ComEA family DNA-binding protein [Actinomycetota bacterium]